MTNDKCIFRCSVFQLRSVGPPRAKSGSSAPEAMMAMRRCEMLRCFFHVGYGGAPQRIVSTVYIDSIDTNIHTDPSIYVYIHTL